MAEINRGERLQIMLTEEEVKALDDWRFARRMPSRASAIRELLRLGLASEGVTLADAASKSKDFGVIQAKGEPQNGHGKSGGSRSGGREA
jgi:Arc/MetJ-type ribon-helix-helix transcriptional regulator